MARHNNHHRHMGTNHRTINMNATPISANITTRAIRGTQTYEAEYDGVHKISLYKIETITPLQELRTYLTGTRVAQHTIHGWGALTQHMEELIDYYISPLLKDLRTT